MSPACARRAAWRTRTRRWPPIYRSCATRSSVWRTRCPVWRRPVAPSRPPRMSCSGLSHAPAAATTSPPARPPNRPPKEVTAFQLSRVRLLLTCLLVAATGGLLLIVITWRPTVKLHLLCRRCELAEADRVLIQDGYGQLFEETIVPQRTDKAGITTPAHFVNKRVKYVWDEERLKFVKLSFLDSSTRCSDLCQHLETGLSHQEYMKRSRLFGQNYMHIQKPSVLKLIYEQGVNPFYIMQLYSFLLWFSSGYFEFAIAVMIIATISIAVTVWEARRQTAALQKHTKSRMSATVLRNGTPLAKDSRDLVPGEVVLLSVHCPYALDCDVVLLSGACVVDESALTGESHPLYKLPLSSDPYKCFDLEENKQNTIFSGTNVLQVKGCSDVLAVVIRTGFDTQKGELVRSIMFPKPVEFQFYRDFTRYVVFCLLLGVIGALYSAYVWHRNGAALMTIILFSLDIVTFVVPAPLPITLSFMYGVVQRRLKRSGIYCLCAKYILLCGNVDVFCFDKTGTLTENELGFAVLVPCEPEQGFGEPVSEPTAVDSDDPRVVALATCHGLSLINGEPRGDPLDLPLFEAVNWKLYEQLPVEDPDFPEPVATYVRPQYVVGAGGATAADLDCAIYKQFPFTAASRHAAVLARRRFGAGLDVYLKGAPEAVARLCDPSTLPPNFQDALDWYTSQGLRVVALAWNPLDPKLDLPDARDQEQEDLERGARFLGLVVMQNAVRGSAFQPLQQLHQVDVTPVMVTGDHLLTAVSVARECALVDKSQTILRVDVQVVASSVKAAEHLNITYTSPETDRNQTFLKGKLKAVHSENYVFAIDGRSFDLLRSFKSPNLRTIVHRCRVFARMAPQQKVQVVELLQELGHQVGMCGDGCNDCGALRTAHAGVSLSPAEPSAAAPFSSAAGTIGAVPALLREGRCALVTSFALFKNILSLGMVSMLMALIVYSHGCEPLSPHYIVSLVVMVLPGQFVLPLAAAAGQLSRRRPPAQLAGPVQVLSSLSFVILQYLGLLAVLRYTAAQPWFEPASVTTKGIAAFNTRENLQPSYEASAMLVGMCFVCIMSFLVFSPGAPFRRPVYTNYALMLVLLLSLVLSSFVMFYRGAVWTSWLQMLYSPYPEYYLVISSFTVAMGLLSYIWETFLLQGYLGQRLAEVFHRLTTKKLPFEVIEEQLQKKTDWPPLKQSEDVEVNVLDLVEDVTETQPPKSEAPDASQSWQARGILKKPSIRDTTWRRDIGGVTASPEVSPSPASRVHPTPAPAARIGFGTFRTTEQAAADVAGLAHRPSIILEEVPIRPVSLVQPEERNGGGGAGDSSEA